MKRGVFVVVMLAALVFAGPAAPSPPASSADEATAYQLDATHDGSIADAGLSAPLTQAWSITLPSAPSYPLIADGMVFVTSPYNGLYAINQATGSTIWSAATYGSTGLAYDRGQVFEWDRSGDLTAFDAATGTIDWSEPIGSNRSNDYGAAPTAVNGVVYVTGSYTVFAVRESDGKTLWTGSVSGEASSPAVTSTGAYVSYACQQAYDFDPVSGSLLWHHSTSCTGGGGATTVVASGTVFVEDNVLGNVMLSAADGSALGPLTAGPPPAVADDVAYMLSGQSPSASLAAIAGAGTGATNWTFNGDGQIDTAPIVANGLVFVGSASNNLYALDATTGATSWSTDLGAAPTALAAANGTLVVSAGSQLMAYRSSGTISDAPSNQSPPTISGPSGTGAIDGADVGIWSGLPNSYAYQWELCDAAGANCANISGANAPTYTPPAGDLGLSLRVTVTATNGVGSSAPVESDWFALGGATGTPALLTAPVVTALDGGTATVGQPLSTTPGTWTNSATSYLYQWQRCDNSGSNCVNIPNATGYLYAPVAADAGHEIRSKILASNIVGSAASYAPSAPTSAVVGVPPPPPADQATAYQLDATHDGYISDAGLTAPLAQAWSITLPSSVVSYPLIVNGTVFVTTADHTLYAINQATGTTIWSDAISGSIGLTYDRGQVFVLSGVGHVLSAFNAATGAIDWSETLGTSNFNSAPTAVNGIVYVGGATVYAVDEDDGHVLWTASVLNGDDSSPAVTSTGMYVSYACQQAYDFDPMTGTLLWHHSTDCEGGGGATTVVADGTVFVRDSIFGNIVLSASSGSELGPFPAGPPSAVANNLGYVVNFSTLSAVGGDGLGTTAWTFGGAGGPDTAPIVAGGLVFVGSSNGNRSNGNLYALDAALGTTSWSTSLGVPPTGLAAANGTLVVVAGSKLMAYQTAGAIASAPSDQAPPTISGSSAFNEIQAADVGIWSGSPSSYTYQWELCNAAGANCADIAGAKGAAFTPPAGDLGSTLRVKVVATNGVGSSPPIESTPSSPLGEPKMPPVVVTSPVVSGTARVGHQLSTSNGTWTNSPTSYLYQWQACDDTGSVCTDIPNATSSQYTPVAAYIGDAIRSEVLASNAEGAASNYAASALTSAVTPVAPPALSTAPVVSGTAKVGQQLSTTTGTWTNTPLGYVYKWQRCDNTGSNCVDIANAPDSQYTLVTADVGYEIRSEVLADNATGPASSYAPSAPASVVVPAGPPATVTGPIVSGTAAVGHQLSTTNGTWTNAPVTGYIYKWQRCTNNGSNCFDIPSATSSKYTPVVADLGLEIRSEVLASNAVGSAASYSLSAPTSVVIPAGRPAIVIAPVVTGTAGVGRHLSTTHGTWTNQPAGYVYKWQRCTSTGSNCFNIPNATSATYTLVLADLGHEIRSVVLASNAVGSAASYAPSAPTSVVLHTPTVITPPKLLGVAAVGRYLSVSTGTWNYSPAHYAYQWFRCTSLGTSCVKIVGATRAAYLLTAADAGHKLKAYVTASNAAGSATAWASNTSATVTS